ncbi:hypothetical protein [Azohydromonas caseinilytica]|uniref:Secreted protein n=1 Tax=Azohydromonas caseinilytica TaxID=2728836 RepID=A0A848F8C8_9BURK|nr:hypothetical protein [Azohydromonas caseinilytica]NML15814.1 hypothetical protein [Azohydromonas caseinilytica]
MTLSFVRLTRFLRRAAPPALLALASPWAAAHDYPTAARVEYVQACMRDHPGSYYEMLNKCSCVLDRLASDIPFDDFVTMSTATNANSIGGERGNTIRDTEPLQKQIREFRKLQAAAREGCFIRSQAAR